MSNDDDMRDEYDFDAMPNGVRGKYAARARAASNVVKLDPDVQACFSTSEAVNGALRHLMQAMSEARAKSA